MTDSESGMAGSDHRYPRGARTLASSVLLAGVVAIAGCGGGGGNKSAAPPSTAKTTPSSGGLVTAQGTAGLVGPAARANGKTLTFTDKKSKINPKLKPRGKKGGVIGEQCNGDVMPADDNLGQMDAAILCLVNAWRADSGLSALAPNPQLQQAAEGMAARMVQEQFFAHDTPDGKTVVDRVEPTGYIPRSSDWVIGENLAWGSGGLSTPQAIVNGWMNSPGHKANILAPDYKDIGLAAALGAPGPTLSGGTTYVNDFGARSGADPNLTLPAETGATTASTKASLKVAAAKKRAAARKKARARKHRRRHRRHKRSRH